jgi:hypothetical protein
MRTLPFLLATAGMVTADPLPAWNHPVSMKAIVSFVGEATKDGSPDIDRKNDWKSVFPEPAK